MAIQKKTTIFISIFITILLIVAVVFYLSNNQKQEIKVVESIPQENIASPPLPEKVVEAVQIPVIVTEKSETKAPEENNTEDKAIEKEILPSLHDSDPIVSKSALTLSTAGDYSKQLAKDDVLRGFVVFIDNLAQGEVLSGFSPLLKPDAPFEVIETPDSIFLDPKSFKRFDAYTNILDKLDLTLVIQQYKRFLPLINDAYQEMGYEKGDFNDTLLNAIDMINETPIIKTQIELIAPSAMYKFKEPQLESLNNTQKLMIRMGPNNLETIKKKLAELRLKLK